MIVALVTGVQHFATLWTMVCQVTLSMGFSKQEYWNRLLFSSPWDLPDPGFELSLLHYRQILYHLNHQGSPESWYIIRLLYLWILNLAIHPGAMVGESTDGEFLNGGTTVLCCAVLYKGLDHPCIWWAERRSILQPLSPGYWWTTDLLGKKRGDIKSNKSSYTLWAYFNKVHKTWRKNKLYSDIKSSYM